MPANEASIELVRGLDYQATWSCVDDEGVGQFGASDTLHLDFFAVPGASAALAVTPGGSGTATGLSSITAATGELLVTIKAADIATIAAALSLSSHAQGRARFALTATTTGSLKYLLGYGDAIIQPEI
jgi:hypothetical protein